MSAGLSTTITITFTPQLNQDINGVLPLLSETGQINIPLICTCKKAIVLLSSKEQSDVDFGQVIYGEQCIRTIKIKNDGALPTKIFVKTVDGHTIPFVNQEELTKKIEEAEKRAASILDNAPPVIGEEEAHESNELAAQEDAEFAKETAEETKARLESEDAVKKAAAYKADPFEEFLA